MVRVELSERITGPGADPWITQEYAAVLVSGYDVCDFQGYVIAQKVGDVWLRSPMIGNGASSQYRKMRIYTVSGRRGETAS